jgi:hypothetical protein
MDAPASGSRILPIPNASALGPNSAPQHDPQNAVQQNPVNKLISKLFLDSEYYNCDYIGLK